MQCDGKELDTQVHSKCVFLIVYKCNVMERNWIPNSLHNVYFCVYNANVMEQELDTQFTP